MKNILLVFQNTFSIHWEFLKAFLYRVSLALRLWGLMIVFPFTLTFFAAILFILGEISSEKVLKILTFWRDFYYNGQFLSIEAWRWHCGILFCCLFYVCSVEGMGISEAIKKLEKNG